HHITEACGIRCGVRGLVARSFVFLGGGAASTGKMIELLHAATAGRCLATAGRCLASAGRLAHRRPLPGHRRPLLGHHWPLPGHRWPLPGRRLATAPCRRSYRNIAIICNIHIWHTHLATSSTILSRRARWFCVCALSLRERRPCEAR